MGRLACIVLLAGLAGGPAAAEPPGGEIQGQIGGTFMLQDHKGRVVRDEMLAGKYMLVYFGYTFCPDVCPTGLQVLSQALDLLGEEAGQVQPLFITVDPERDTSAVLADYVAAFHPAILGLTGPRPFVESVIAKYKVKVARADTPNLPGGYSVDHTASLFLMDRRGEYLRRFPHGTTSQDIAADLGQRIRADAAK